MFLRFLFYDIITRQHMSITYTTFSKGGRELESHFCLFVHYMLICYCSRAPVAHGSMCLLLFFVLCSVLSTGKPVSMSVRFIFYQKYDIEIIVTYWNVNIVDQNAILHLFTFEMDYIRLAIFLFLFLILSS